MVVLPYPSMLQRAEAALRAPEALQESSIASPETMMRALFEAQSFSLNGALLHKLYFENLSPVMGSAPNKASADLLSAMAKCSKVAGGAPITEQLIGAGMSSKNGFAMLCFDFEGASLRITTIEGYDDGVVLRNMPLLVLDCWEHAYWGDWGIDRVGYLREACKHIRWDIVSDRYEKALRAYNSKVPT